MWLSVWVENSSIWLLFDAVSRTSILRPFLGWRRRVRSREKSRVATGRQAAEWNIWGHIWLPHQGLLPLAGKRGNDVLHLFLISEIACFCVSRSLCTTLSSNITQNFLPLEKHKENLENKAKLKEERSHTQAWTLGVLLLSFVFPVWVYNFFCFVFLFT